MQTTPERLAFEADRARMQLEGRLVMKSIMNALVADLEEVHLSHNEKGLIPRVSLDIADQSKINAAARILLGTVDTSVIGRVDDDHS